MKRVKRQRYNSDFKDRALALVNLGRSVPDVAQELGIGDSILYRWVQAHRQSGQPSSTQLDGEAQRAGGELNEASELRRSRPKTPGFFSKMTFLKKPQSSSALKPRAGRAMILQLHSQTQAIIRQICHVLELPRSGFYHAAKPTTAEAEDRRLGALIEEIFKRNRRRYGYRRIAQELRDHDIVCAPARLSRLMRQRGLRAIQPKNYLPKTSDGRANRPREPLGQAAHAHSNQRSLGR